MKISWPELILVALCTGLALALGLAGTQIARQLTLKDTTILLAGALLIFVLLAVLVRIKTPRSYQPSNEAIIVLPLTWSTFFVLGLLAGLLLQLAFVRLVPDQIIANTIRLYEIVGLSVGLVLVLALAFRGNPLPAAAFGLGYGLSMPSAVMLLAPDNTALLTYGGHLSAMLTMAALVLLFGRYVRIEIVE